MRVKQNLKLLKDLKGYKLYQDNRDKKLYVSIPFVQNCNLRIYSPKADVVTLDDFLEHAVKLSVLSLLDVTNFRAKVEVALDREHIIITNKTRLYEHSATYHAMIRKTTTEDNISDLIPFKITIDRDGNFFSIQTSAIETDNFKIYHWEDYITVTHIKEGIVRILSTALVPCETFYYAASCISAAVHFHTYLQSHN